MFLKLAREVLIQSVRLARVARLANTRLVLAPQQPTRSARLAPLVELETTRKATAMVRTTLFARPVVLVAPRAQDLATRARSARPPTTCWMASVTRPARRGTTRTSRALLVSACLATRHVRIAPVLALQAAHLAIHR